MKEISIGLILSAAMLMAAEVQDTPAATLAPAKKAAPKATPKTTTKAAPKAATKTTAKAAQKPAPKGKAETEVPKGAVMVEPGTYRWVDPKGVAWMYNVTPWGLMKGPEVKAPPDEIPTDWKITDEGDSVAFEKPYPFGGVQKWTRKKSELTDIEKAVLQKSQGAGAASASSGK